MDSRKNQETEDENMNFFDSLQGNQFSGKLFQRDEYIFREGEPTSEGICLLLKGQIRSESIDRGTKSIQRNFTPGMLFGLSALVSETRIKSFLADDDNTYVIYIKEDDFHKSVVNDEKFFINILQSSIERLQRIPSSNLKKPEDQINLNTLLGEGAAKKFQAIRDQNLKILSYVYKLKSRTALPNEIIFQEDKSEDSDIYMLLEGSVHQFLKTSSENPAEIPVIDLQPGALFGFLRKSDREGHFLNAKAGADGAKLIHLDSDLLLKVSKLDTDLAWSIFQNVVITIAIIEMTMIKY